MSLSTVCRGLLLWLLCVLAGAVQAESNLLVFVFKGGEVQPGVAVQVADQTASTDAYGLAGFSLAAGSHDVSALIAGELISLTRVSVHERLKSQVFVNLHADQATAHLDLPLTERGFDVSQEQLQEISGPLGDMQVQLTDAESGEPVVGARLFVKGLSVEGETDAQGIVSLALPVGTHDITLIHPRYAMRVQRDVSISEAEARAVSVTMVPANIMLDEHVVSAPFVEGSLASAVAAMKEKDVVGEALSSEQFSKSGDSSAAAALKRVTAITIIDGKFVFVRGLGERYSTILLNDLHVPSPEPTKRVVPLDIFPTDVIQSMDIQKTFSSDLPGTFAGGTVLIHTRDIPKEDNFVQGSVSLGVNDATGEDQRFNDDNAKVLPGLLLSLSNNFSVLTQEVVLNGQVLADGITADEKQRLNRAMVSYRDFGLTQRTTLPEGGLSATLGQGFKTSGGLKYGVAANLYYKRSDDATTLTKEEFQFEPTGDNVVHVETSEQSVTQLTDKYGGLLSVALDDEIRNKLKYTLVFLNESENLTNFAAVNQRVESRLRERTFLQLIERSLVTHQFNGEHLINLPAPDAVGDLQVNWGVSTAIATRQEPGSFEYEYKEGGDGFIVDSKKLFFLYSDLEDDADNYRVDIRLPYTLWGREHHTRIGYFALEKTRRLDNRRFKFEYANTLDSRPIDDALSLETLATGELDVLDAYKPDDFYTADLSEKAFYLNQMIRPLDNLQLSLGVRQETSTQRLQVGLDRRVSSLKTSDALPFIAMTLDLTQDSQLRAGYSKSISRPDFREFSPNRFKDPITEEIVFGFDQLRATTIHNLDLKYEVFPTFDEFYSVGVFLKDFTDPIETVRTISDVDVEISFRNAKQARSVGVELGFRKGLSAYADILNNFFVSGNYAYIDSQIELDKTNPANANDQFIPFLTSDKRAMQGQSPYIVNLSFGYDNFHTRRSATLLYNVFGERIATLGINGNPDIVEEPFHRLDFVAKWGLNDTYDEQRKKIGYTLGLKITNILGSERSQTQAGRDVLSLSPGRSFDVSFTMKY